MIPVTLSDPVTVVNDPSVRLTDNQQTAGKSVMILTVVGVIAFIVLTE
ncbi:MAG: hypothetical protein ACR2MG_20985 [Pyrinomonadaceae bacterium]